MNQQRRFSPRLWDRPKAVLAAALAFAPLVVLASAGIWLVAGNALATTECTISLSVTSPSDGVVHGAWETSGCPTIRAQYQMKLTTETDWQDTLWVTTRSGEVRRFIMESVPAGQYEFRVAVDKSGLTEDRVNLVSRAGPDKTYGSGDVIRVRVTWENAVTVTGTPRLAIDMDPAEWGTKHATYESGSGSKSLTFAHTVVEPNISTKGVAVLVNSLELNGGTIRHADNTAADLELPAIPHGGDQSSHKVNWQTASDGNATVASTDGVPDHSPTVELTIGPITGQPTNVSAHVQAHHSLRVAWDHPASTPTGTTRTGYYVEYRVRGVDQYTRSELLAADKTSLRIYALTRDAEYEYRLLAQYTDSASETSLIASVTQNAGRLRYILPLHAWWIDGTPQPSFAVSRIFMTVDTSYGNASGRCDINGATINCIPRNLVSLEMIATGTYTIVARAWVAGNTRGLDHKTKPVVVSSEGMTGCRLPEEKTRLSGSDDTLQVWWGSTVPCSQYGFHVGWILEHDKPDGTTETSDLLPVSQQTYTYTGQAAGVHTVRVYPVSYSDHDRNTATVSKLVRGFAMPHAAILRDDFTEAPGQVTRAAAESGEGKISVTWDYPASALYYLGVESLGPDQLHADARSPIHRYDIRYRLAANSFAGAGKWREESAHPYYFHSGTVAAEDRLWKHDIGDLENKYRYDVEIRAVSAAGEGQWLRVGSGVPVN